MKLNLEPTDEFLRVDGTLCRRWEGSDGNGTPVHAYIATVQPQTNDSKLLESFEIELQALPPLREGAVRVDYRFIVD